MEKYMNDYDKECWRGVDNDTPFKESMFHPVAHDFDDSVEFALHTNIGSITVLDRMTGYGCRDTETGFRDVDGKFWLASGSCDIRRSCSETFGEAIEWIKKFSNTCKGV